MSGLIVPAQFSCVTSTIISTRRKLSHRPLPFPRSPRWSWHFTAKHFILWSVAISCKLLLGLLRSRSVSAALCNLAYNFTLVESLWDSLRAMITVILWGGGFMMAVMAFSENIILWTLMLLSLPHPPLISPLLYHFIHLSTAAPYSIRNLSDSTLIQYELDSKFCYVSVWQKKKNPHTCICLLSDSIPWVIRFCLKKKESSFCWLSPYGSSSLLL